MLVGITASIGMGKSTVSNYLISLGYKVIDTDKVSRDLLSNKDVIEEIVDYFSSDILINGEINRKDLAKRIFDNEDDRLKLNSIVHPRVVSEVKKESYDKDELIFVDIPLLFEVDLVYLVDKIIVVYTDKLVQLKRLMERDNIDEAYALKKISSQMDVEYKKEKADYLIDNNKSINYTYRQVDQIIRRLKNEI